VGLILQLKLPLEDLTMMIEEAARFKGAASGVDLEAFLAMVSSTPWF
jgi:hypothetical protein